MKLPFGDSSLAYTPSNWYLELTTNNIRPQLPQNMHPELRSILERSWVSNPLDRPTAVEMYEVLERIVTNYVPEMPCGRIDTSSDGSGVSVISNV